MTTDPAPRPGDAGGPAATERPDPAALRRLLAALPAGDLPLWCQTAVSPSCWAANGELFADAYAYVHGNAMAARRATLIVAAVNALPALLDRLEAAEAALAFYGDPDTYAWPPPEPTPMGPGDPWQTRAQLDKGARARAALAGAGEEGA